MEDETKAITLTSDELTTLKIALDNYIADNRFGATLNEEFAADQAKREALRDKLYRIGLWENGPFAVVMRVEETSNEG